MATRENQGLQIALIVFLMITVALAISTYYFFRQAEEYEEMALQAERKAKTQEDLAKSRHYQVQALKLMIGVPTVSAQGLEALRHGLVADEGIKEIDAIRKDFDADMKLFDASVPETERNWRKLPEYLAKSLAERNSQVVDRTAAEKNLQTEKDTLAANTKKQVDDAMNALAATKDDVVAVQEKFAKAEQDSEEARKAVEEQVTTRIAQLNKELEGQIAKVNESDKKQREISSQLAGVAAKLDDLRRESFERPHGRVTDVNIRTNSVYINLGRADGLRRQMTFSIYDPSVATLDIPNPADERTNTDEQKKKPKRKGSIEVIDVLDDHLAEARILEDEVTNPILPGDYLFTPAWRPGERLQFALVGRINIDDDADDDRDTVRRIIEVNGGEVVADVPPLGEPTGNITVNTRFIVIGERPDEVADAQVLARYNNMIAQAERSGVQQIGVKDLLSMMGYKGTNRSVTLGTAGPADVDTKKADPRFRPRPRPAANGNDAFR